MRDYKNHKPKKDLAPVIEGICFVGSMLLLVFFFLLLGA
jgi:hypothetical protein